LLSALNKIEFYSTPRTEVLSAIPPLGHRNSFGTLGKNNNHLRWAEFFGVGAAAAVAANKPKIFVFSRPIVDLLI